jgi:hypothetical protein
MDVLITFLPADNLLADESFKLQVASLASASASSNDEFPVDKSCVVVAPTAIPHDDFSDD